MRLDAFLLADAATATGGKLYIHGGGVTRIEAPTMPYILPTISLVAVFAIEEADDPDTAHTFGLHVLGPEEEEIIPRADVRVEPGEDRPALAAGEQPSYQLCLNFGPLNFRREGEHHLHFFVDGTLARDLPLPVVHRESHSHFVVEPSGEETETDGGAS